MRNKKGLIFAVFSILILGAYFVLPYIGDTGGSKRLDRTPSEPKFKQEAEAYWLKSNGDTISNVKLELAETPYEIEVGLMYRSRMAQNHGMLFVFPDERPRSFWMKNTKISLDICYLDSKYNLVSAAELASPYSEKSLPSTYPAKYVLELNGGYLKQFGVQAGDRIVLE
ncbi:MAG: uncharacterized membrane protein (UPF0127 family) [Sphingobacteriales bacterium]|jgi:uncharacterized membrane protein (UPF0127 family)